MEFLTVGETTINMGQVATIATYPNGEVSVRLISDGFSPSQKAKTFSGAEAETIRTWIECNDSGQLISLMQELKTLLGKVTSKPLDLPSDEAIRKQELASNGLCTDCGHKHRDDGHELIGYLCHHDNCTCTTHIPF